MAAEVAAAFAFIFVGDEGAADLDLVRGLSTERERKRVKPRGLFVVWQGAGGTGTALGTTGWLGWTEKETAAERGVLGSCRKTDV